MYNKLIKNDIRKSKLITTTITAFILIAAMLTSLSAALIVNLLGAIDNLLIEARSPHFMQMHTGDLDIDELQGYADGHSNVADFQVREFLNIDGASIVVGDDTLAWSIQDNGFSTQSETFDFLFDLENNIIQPTDGELYVPIYYMKQGTVALGDTVEVNGVPFTVAGFLRDSQMNASLISSKRFLVSEHDFEKIRSFGIMEYLIEFRLNDTSQILDFETAYMEAGLPANGPPAITRVIIELANAIVDGMMIAVLVLISLLVTVVAFLCIRFTLLAKIEEDYREIGVLKAVGLRVTDIKKLYTVKYGAIAGVACVVGFLLSLVIQNPFMENIRLYLGESNRVVEGVLFGILGALLIFMAVMGYVNGVLRRFRKISAAQAIRFGAPQEKSKAIKGITLSGNKLFSSNVFLGMKDVLSRKKLYATMLAVLVISSFIMNVPQNIYSTLSAKSFMTYMGVGECDLNVNVMRTLTDDVAGSAAKIEETLAEDSSVARYTVFTCKLFPMLETDGSMGQLRVDLGDHSAFPISYSSGQAPQTKMEIAISNSNADELEKKIGDEIVLLVDGEETHLTVCGTYSDITNGGFTAKAFFEANQGEALWMSIPVAFYDSVEALDKVVEYRYLFPFAKVSGVEEHMEQSLGDTVAAVKIASYVSIGLAIVLTTLVTMLFMKMLVVKDRYAIAILKSIGFTSGDIRKQYITRGMVVLVVGVVLGTLLSNTLGELVGVALISSFGASTFDFAVDPLFSYLFSPLLIALCIYVATVLGISDIGALKLSEHIKEA